MPLSFYRIVCGECDRIISDGWPADAPPEQCLISKHTCRECEEDARAMGVAEALARKSRTSPDGGRA